MEKKAAYTCLAEWFEYLNDDCGYENWSQYLFSQLKRFPLRSGLDIGCGSGRFTRAFQRAGYEMTGLDVSAEMLNKAEETALREGVKSEYLLGDISRFSSPRKFDFALAINDCVNYIPKEKLFSKDFDIEHIIQTQIPRKDCKYCLRGRPRRRHLFKLQRRRRGQGDHGRDALCQTVRRPIRASGRNAYTIYI